MDLVADVAPSGDKPGLLAFLCPNCGNTQSNLIHDRSSRPKQQQQQIQPKKPES